MRALLLSWMLAFASPLLALTPNLPAGTLGPGMLVETRLGPMPNCIVDAPRPIIPRAIAQQFRARGVYALDFSVATGVVFSVRVLQSSGNKFLDDIAIGALQNWRIRPRSIYKLIVPIDFTGARVALGARS